MRRLLVLCVLVLAGCGGTTVVREEGVTVSGAPTAAPVAGAPAARRRGADRGRHARPGVEQVLGHHPQRGRLRRAPARRARRLPVARRLLARADERADRPGGRHQARRAGRLDPRAGTGAGDPPRGEAPASRSSRSTPAAGDFKALGVLAHVGQLEDRAGLEAGRRLADAGVRRALCINQQVGNTGLDARCAGLERAMREAGGTSSVLEIVDDDPGTPAPDRPIRRPRTAPKACWPRTRSAAWPRPRGSRARE